MAISESNPLDKKVQKVLQINLLDDKDLQNALHALGHFYKENSLENRRFLKSEIETKNLNISLEFLDSFKKIKELMDTFDNKILAMTTYCQNIQEQINNTKKKTNEIIDEAKLLMSERQNLKEKSAFVKMFFQKYLLMPEEVRKLETTSDGNIDEEFIKVVTKIMCINAESQDSLYQYNLSQDMVDRIIKENSSYYHKALDILTKWAKDQCRLLTGDNVYIKPLLKKALLLLQPQACSEEIYQELVMARKNSVNNLFINAMTQEGPGGVPKPIELHAHDPLRYVGDMLAWVHQFLMSESEIISSLSTQDLEPYDGAADGPTQSKHQHLLDDKMKSLLADIMEGISRPLKIRVEQIIVSESKEVILFKLANMIQFYVYTLGEYLPTKSHFVCMLREMDQLTRDKLMAAFSVYVRKLEEKSDRPSRDLYPTAYFSYILSIMKDMLSAKSTFMTTMAHDSSIELNKITEKLLNPLVQTVKISSNYLENSIKQNVYQLNCFHHIYHTLKPNRSDIYATDYVKHLENLLDVANKIESLAEDQAQYVLGKTGLTLLHQRLFLQGNEPSKVQENLNEDLVHGQESELELCNVLSSSLLLFDQYLSAPDLNVLCDISLLQDVDIKETVLDKSCALILQTYELIYKELTNEANLEKESHRSLSTVINQLKTPQQIAALL